MKKIILIIDDEEQDRKAMAVLLEKEECAELFLEGSGKKGIETAKKINPDIILIDVVLQDCDGFDVCMEIRNANIRSKIIMVTGHLDAVNAKKAVNSGADEIIEKQAGFNNVYNTVRNLINEGKKT